MEHMKNETLAHIRECLFCKKEFTNNDLRNHISIREADISGLCQECQDEIFGED